MLKGLFFGAPSVSVCNTLYPVLEALISDKYEIIAYNLEDFAPPANYRFSFKQYPPYQNGYHPGCMDEHTTYLQFGEILIDTSVALTDYILKEIEKEKPDFILHSHLAVWGRLVAAHFKLPAITFFTTFILDKKIMLSYFVKNVSRNGQAIEHLRSTVRFTRKLKKLHQQLQLTQEPDIWNIYINPTSLNVSFIIENFQPDRLQIGADFKFLGYPAAPALSRIDRDIIYISMGTILNRNTDFYKLCIEALLDVKTHCVLVIGKSIDRKILGVIPAHIEVVEFADQTKILQRSLLFITRGGMASVHESVYRHTPMIVVPEMAEQQLTAQKVEEMGIGIHLPPATLCKDLLKQAITNILQDHDWYTANLEALLATVPTMRAEERAVRHITTYLNNNNTSTRVY